ncbi:Inositol-tetrakisphosphate 1-kinase 2 [Raphanus sativus]|uniref:Inositol-tetrakisphosphate 1-kinase n=1 Tax=Raphanus sativus TaxID=3726 RepID=A0A6J0MZE4_RAPSA|nr:inositol-tetrakisphosphate 1-kinase 2 [Raphanus sativus]XP_056859806.1 inositol-tetrakisphosphate 1-kinase 2-like [Raphanus sativus]KAJ4914221.1 Inositol-tetrakisphosphate 1-kinase 2 [Raphanus sativus]KAJ4914232.1 Inositol-tetrakisphosphate 1-kinase 2 [Raphanus sativus]
MFGTLASGDIETARLRRNLGVTRNLGFSCGGFDGMRLEDDNMKPQQHGGDDEGEQVADETSPFQIQQHPFQQIQQKLVVGYALTSKKKKSFLQPKLELMARRKGICFVAIDLNRPLSEQGPFDVVLHKLLGKEWQEVIEGYQQTHPEVTVLDPPNAIQRIYNRQSMLQGMAELKLSDCSGSMLVPKQMVVLKDSASSADKVVEAGLKYPLVAKPLWIDGTAKSHQLFLAYDRHSLAELDPPLVLQEFVNHGGVMFKVFVVGDIIKVVRRFSLPNISNCDKAKVDGAFQFPRVSSSAASADNADLDPSVAELPPKSFLEALVKELRTLLGLRLFNIDMIREHGSENVFYVIDVNYFPGYGKMPDYEQVFVDFFCNLAQARHKKRHCK